MNAGAGVVSFPLTGGERPLRNLKRKNKMKRKRNRRPSPAERRANATAMVRAKVLARIAYVDKDSQAYRWLQAEWNIPEKLVLAQAQRYGLV